MIYGGVKFFKNYDVSTTSVTVTSGINSAKYLLDSNRDTFYRSVSSNDAITEEIILIFGSSKKINRFFGIDINWKEFNIQYLVNGVYEDFENVVSPDGGMIGINEVSFNKDTAYYQFDSIDCDGIRVQVTKTQSSNEEKHVSRIVVTEEIGTFYGYPTVQGVTSRKNSKSLKSESGHYFISKGLETLEISLAFRDYPIGKEAQDDLNLMFTLDAMGDPFFTWLCGGLSGEDYFRHTLKGFDLKDLLLTQVIGDPTSRYKDNIYTNPANVNFKLVEHG